MPRNPRKCLAAEAGTDFVKYLVTHYSTNSLFPETSEPVSITPIYAPNDNKSRDILADHSHLLLGSIENSHMTHCRMACVDNERLRVCSCCDFIEVLIDVPLDPIKRFGGLFHQQRGW